MLVSDIPPLGFYCQPVRKTKNPVWCRWCERKLVVVKQAIVCEKCDQPSKTKGILG